MPLEEGLSVDGSSGRIHADAHTASTTVHLRPPRPVPHLACRHRPYPYPPQCAQPPPPPAILMPNTVPRTPTAQARTCVCRSDGKNGVLLSEALFGQQPYVHDDVERSATEFRVQSVASVNALANRAALGPLPSGWETRMTSTTIHTSSTTTRAQLPGTTRGCSRPSTWTHCSISGTIGARWCICGASRLCGLSRMLSVMCGVCWGCSWRLCIFGLRTSGSP